jgi:hypothetical protein
LTTEVSGAFTLACFSVQFGIAFTVNLGSWAFTSAAISVWHEIAFTAE